MPERIIRVPIKGGTLVVEFRSWDADVTLHFYRALLAYAKTHRMKPPKVFMQRDVELDMEK